MGTAVNVNLYGSEIKVNSSTSYSGFWRSVNEGRWEQHTLAVIDSILKPGGTYIDIGAWIGPTVLKAAQKAGKVIAYEPDPVAQGELRANVQLNGLTNVEIRGVALFDQEGTMKFGGGYANELGQSVSSLMYGDKGVDVSVKDIAQEVLAPEFQQCQLLKIDVEGAEYRLIKRMRPYLEKVRPAMLLSTHSKKITGRPGVKGFLSQMSDLYSLVTTLDMYEYLYIETREGWKRFTGFEKAKFVMSANSNRQILALKAPLNLSA